MNKGALEDRLRLAKIIRGAFLILAGAMACAIGMMFGFILIGYGSPLGEFLTGVVLIFSIRLVYYTITDFQNIITYLAKLVVYSK